MNDSFEIAKYIVIVIFGLMSVGIIIGIISELIVIICRLIMNGFIKLCAFLLKLVGLIISFSFRFLFTIIIKPWLIFMPRKLLVELFKPKSYSVHPKAMKL